MSVFYNRYGASGDIRKIGAPKPGKDSNISSIFPSNYHASHHDKGHPENTDSQDQGVFCGQGAASDASMRLCYGPARYER